MHKKCEEILNKLQSEGKIKISDYQFPPKQELKLKLKDMLEDEVDEKYYLSDKMVKYITKNGEVKPKENFNVIDSYNKKLTDNGISGCVVAGQGRNQGSMLMIKNATKKGYLEAYPGDGVYTNTSTKRGTVQPQSIQTLTTFQDKGVVMNDLRIRKLTPKECWRLMGFDDADFDKAQKVNSNTQLYKQAGNSIVVNVLEEILKELLLNE